MAHKAATGAAKQGRDSESKRLGVKLFDGQPANPGNVLIRQRGTKFLPGRNVKKGSDDTLYAIKKGTVKFETKTKRLFDGNTRRVKVINII